MLSIYVCKLLSICVCKSEAVELKQQLGLFLKRCLFFSNDLVMPNPTNIFDLGDAVDYSTLIGEKSV